MVKKYYDLLNLNQNASADQAKKAYIREIKKYHPDLYPGEKSFAEAKTIAINEAYQIVIKDIKSKMDGARKEAQEKVEKINKTTEKQKAKNVAAEQKKKERKEREEALKKASEMAAQQKAEQAQQEAYTADVMDDDGFDIDYNNLEYNFDTYEKPKDKNSGKDNFMDNAKKKAKSYYEMFIEQEFEQYNKKPSAKKEKKSLFGKKEPAPAKSKPKVQPEVKVNPDDVNVKLDNLEIFSSEIEGEIFTNEYNFDVYQTKDENSWSSADFSRKNRAVMNVFIAALVFITILIIMLAVF